ncbi:hypothetical protein [Bacillus sp. 2205SS5-2]|uniref:hypothetical protein n=1 Tax=Bacillus sp. 2205SS5-2 TaxID=3109031 RepID=UPI00300555C7
MEQWYDQLKKWQNTNQLLFVEYVVIRMGTSSFSGRLLDFPPSSNTFLFYNDDTKSVLSLAVSQIDKIEPFHHHP